MKNDLGGVMQKIILLFILFLPCQVYSQQVTLGYFNLRPHVYQDDNGDARGPLIDFLSQYIAPELGVTFIFSYAPLPRILKNMEDGKLVGAVILGKTKQRRRIYDYPTHNFYTMRSVIAVGKNSPLKEISSPDDLKKLDIGYFRGGIVSPYMQKHNIKFINIYGMTPWIRNLNKMLLNRIDAVYSPLELNMISTAKKYDIYDKIKIIRIPEEPMKLYTAFSKIKFHPRFNLVAQYDAAFKKINGQQVYKKLLEQHLNNANYLPIRRALIDEHEGGAEGNAKEPFFDLGNLIPK
jgi:ABC-type amino acid transport substrate-binding protein